MKIDLSTSLLAQRQLGQTTKAIQRSLERLSTGKRVNSPRDDVAAYALSIGLDSQIRGLRQANLNINQAVGLVQTVDAALSSQTDIVQKMRELAVQAANGSLGSSDRDRISNELISLREEFQRIATNTSYGELSNLLSSDSEFSIQSGASKGETLELGLSSTQAQDIFRKDAANSSFSSFADIGSVDNFDHTDVTDLNLDGNNDFISLDETNNLMGIHLGDGTGNFSALSTFSVSSSAEDFSIGDVNGDSIQDIIVSDTSTQIISVFLGNGDGSFASSQDLDIGASVKGVAVADFNGDGVDEILVGTSTSLSSYAFDAGNLNLIEETASSGGNTSLDLGDFNGDGQIDVGSRDNASNFTSIFLGDGTGGFEDVSTISSSISKNTFFADFNGDGFDDLIGTGVLGSTVKVALSNGDGSFGTVTALSTPAIPNEINLTDYDGDGNLDILVLDYGASINVYLGDGSGNFSSHTEVNLGSGNITGFAVGDFNGDGVSDIISGRDADDIIRVSLMNTQSISAVSDFVLSNTDDASNLIQVLDNSLNLLTERRSSLAITLNQLETRYDYNQKTLETKSEAKSQIEDADFALETAELVKQQILQQAQIATLSQSNLNMQMVLGLLDGL